LVAPVLDTNITKPVYLPTADNWYDVLNDKIVSGEQVYDVNTGGKLLDIPYFIRVGSAMATVDLNITDNVNLGYVTAASTPISITIIAKLDYSCYGFFYLDDGVTYDQKSSL